MPNPIRGDASAGPHDIEPGDDELVEIHDLDSSFDLGVFSVEHHTAKPAAPAPAVREHVDADGPRPPVRVVEESRAGERSAQVAPSVVTFPTRLGTGALAHTGSVTSILHTEPAPVVQAPRTKKPTKKEPWPPWVTGVLSFAAVVLVAVVAVWFLPGSSAAPPRDAGQVQAATSPPAAPAAREGARATGGDGGTRERAMATAGGSAGRGPAAASSAAASRAAAGQPRTPSRLTVPRDPSGRPAGWASIDVPPGLELRIDGVPFTASVAERTLLAAGTHRIEVASAAAGFRATRTVQVQPGEITVVPLDIPKGLLTVEAQPSASVILDGVSVGTTPIAGMAVPVGMRTVTVRDILLGERTYRVVVREARVTTLRVDLREK